MDGIDVVIHREGRQSEVVWPAGIRVPVVGDHLDLVDGFGYRRVSRVIWTVSEQAGPLAVWVEVEG